MINQVPNIGRIPYIIEGKIQKKEDVIDAWKRTEFLKVGFDDKSKGWFLDVMRCIDFLGKVEFQLSEVYDFEKSLSDKHPHNYHVKDKIRQQLQKMRDEGLLEFVSRGKYRIINCSK